MLIVYINVILFFKVEPILHLNTNKKKHFLFHLKQQHIYSPTLIVLRSRHGPLCPLDLTTRSPVAKAADRTGQMMEARCNISSNSTLVTSLRAGHSLAQSITEVPRSNNARTNGKIPRTMSTPLLSTNTAAQ